MFHKWIKTCAFSSLLLSLFSNTVYAQVEVFACEPEWASLVRTLGGDRVRVYSATTAQQDPHHIQARPSLIAKVRRAELLVCTGAELETGWLPLLLRKSGNGKIQQNQQGYFMAAAHVSLLDKPAVLDRSLGDIHAAGNPHFHLDPYRMMQIADALCANLQKIDPENSSFYQQNLSKFNDDWKYAISQWEKQAQSLKDKKIVVSHDSWIYLEQWLGLTKVAVLEPKPGSPPSSGHLSHVLSLLKHNPADIILYADYQSDKSAQWLSQRTKISTIGLPFSPSSDENLIQWFDRFFKQLLSTELLSTEL